MAAYYEIGWAVRIAVGGAARNDLVGIGGRRRIPLSMRVR